MNYVSSTPSKVFIIKKKNLRTAPNKSEALKRQTDFLNSQSKMDNKGNIIFSEQIKVVE